MQTRFPRPSVRPYWRGNAAAQSGALSALDYQEITHLINRYAYGIDT
jgi:hypothetical protein